MTRDDIIEAASKAGFETKRDMIWVDQWEITPTLTRFAALVAAAERNRLISEGWRQCAQGQKTSQWCAQAEQARQEAERFKASAAMWRNKTYELGGTPLPWDADEMLEKAIQAEREACARVCDEYAQARYAANAIRARGHAQVADRLARHGIPMPGDDDGPLAF